MVIKVVVDLEQEVGQVLLGDGAGGGGASGYASSEVELLNSLELPGGTELGGNDDVAFITLEAFVTSPDNNYPPYIPPASGGSNVERENSDMECFKKYWQ